MYLNLTKNRFFRKIFKQEAPKKHKMPLKAQKEEEHRSLILKELHGSREAIQHLLHPLMVEFHLKDILQVMVGASILAIPVGFTEETWHLGEALPVRNVLGLLLISVLFVSAFVYYNYYRNSMKTHWDHFAKRVFSTYVFSFLVVALLLTMIQRAPWSTDWILAFKRCVIDAFPSSMSAAVADMIK